MFSQVFNGVVRRFCFLVLLHAAYFWVFPILFLSFPETNFGSAEAEKASVKDEGGLLTACAYEALTLWPVSVFLKY